VETSNKRKEGKEKGGILDFLFWKNTTVRANEGPPLDKG